MKSIKQTLLNTDSGSKEKGEELNYYGMFLAGPFPRSNGNDSKIITNPIKTNSHLSTSKNDPKENHGTKEFPTPRF